MTADTHQGDLVKLADKWEAGGQHPSGNDRYMQGFRDCMLVAAKELRAALQGRAQEGETSDAAALVSASGYWDHAHPGEAVLDYIGRLAALLAPSCPDDDRAAFEAWRRRTTNMVDRDGSVAREGFGEDADYANRATRSMWIGWKGRAALAQAQKERK